MNMKLFRERSLCLKMRLHIISSTSGSFLWAFLVRRNRTQWVAGFQNPLGNGIFRFGKGLPKSLHEAGGGVGPGRRVDGFPPSWHCGGLRLPGPPADSQLLCLLWAGCRPKTERKVAVLRKCLKVTAPESRVTLWSYRSIICLLLKRLSVIHVGLILWVL